MKQHLLILFILITHISFAQEKASSMPLKNGMSAGLNLSSNGIGPRVAMAILKNEKLVARLEGRYYYKEISESKVDADQNTWLVDGYFKRGSIGLLVDYHPFNNAFKITAGYSFLLNEVYNTAILKDSLQQGGIKISPEEIGSISGGYKINARPYLGIGIGRAIPKKRLGFSFEVGTYITNVPVISYKATNLLAPGTGMYPAELFVDDFKSYPLLPLISFGMSVKLGKL